MKKPKLFEMFAGYGGASFALKKAGIDFECVGYSEIDKYAIQCYEQNHKRWSDEPKGLGITCYGDVVKIDPMILPNFDLLTGGFPCQSFSVAGKGLGELDTRGTLFNEIIRIAEVKKPKYMLLENVKGLTSKKHKATFDKILSELKRIGYYVQCTILNSKEHGIPQNRERVWFVCFRKDTNYEKLSTFMFPEKEELKIFLKDILEDEVDSKYYLNPEKIKKILNIFKVSGKLNSNPSGKGMNGNISVSEISPTVTTNKGEGHKILIGHSRDKTGKTINYHPLKIAGTLKQPSGNQENYVLSQPLRFLNRNQKNLQGNYSSCIDSSNTNGIRIGKTIRKLTPTECFRLMGFLNDEINLDGLSNTQRYKLAGNGWDINLVSKIFKNMLNEYIEK